MFFKLLRYDLKQGIGRQRGKLSVSLLVFLFICFFTTWAQRGYFANWPQVERTLGDYLLTFFIGQSEYDPKSLDPFQFPALWMLLMVLALYMVLSYPLDDLHGFGRQLLINSRQRVSWWLSKSFWTVSVITLYVVLLLAVTVLFCALSGHPLTLSFEPRLLNILLKNNDPTSIPLTVSYLPLETLVLPWLTLVALALLQQTLALLLGPLFGFLISVTLLLASSYLTSPWLLGVYAMAARSRHVVENGLTAGSGFILLPLVSLVSVAIGAFYFRRYDILSKA